MSLIVDIVHRRGSFELAADFTLSGGLTVLFGPSGSGKTTIINLVSGLLRPTQGRIVMGETVWADAEKRIFLPPYRRRIGYVFQEGRLFPHMTVRQNLAYGRRFVPRAERRDDFDHVVDLLGIGHLLEGRPARLSGGEKQRVALGRALLASPRLLLMDEPLSALDGELKAAILPYIERIRDEVGIPILYVSHSQEEVARLATRIVAVREGRTRLIAAPGEAMALLPAIAGLSGAGSFLHARVIAQHREEGMTVAECGAGRLFLRYADLEIGRSVRVFVPAADIILATDPIDAISTLNRFAGVVTSLDDNGGGISVGIDCHGERLVADVTRRSASVLGLEAGKPVTVLFKAMSVGPQALFRVSAS